MTAEKFVSDPPELGLHSIVMEVCSGSGGLTSGAVDEFLQWVVEAKSKNKHSKTNPKSGRFTFFI
jgi:hypothetical protein